MQLARALAFTQYGSAPGRSAPGTAVPDTAVPESGHMRVLVRESGHMRVRRAHFSEIRHQYAHLSEIRHPPTRPRGLARALRAGRERVLKREGPLVEGAAGDGALDHVRAERRQGP